MVARRSCIEMENGTGGIDLHSWQISATMNTPLCEELSSPCMCLWNYLGGHDMRWHPGQYDLISEQSELEKASNLTCQICCCTQPNKEEGRLPSLPTLCLWTCLGVSLPKIASLTSWPEFCIVWDCREVCAWLVRYFFRTQPKRRRHLPSSSAYRSCLSNCRRWSCFETVLLET